MKLRHLLSCLLLGLWLTAGPAQAHWADMAAMELDIGAQGARAELMLPTPFVAAQDLDRDGRLSPAEITAGRSRLEGFLNQHIELRQAQTPVRLSLRPAPQAGASARAGTSLLLLDWHWQGQAGPLSLRYDLFPAEAPNAHCLVSLQHQGAARALVFDRSRIDQALSRAAPASFGETLSRFLLLGLEHIVTGYDHLLFLLALLLVSSRLPYLLKIVTSFTLAHSVTLCLAVLGLVSAPGRWVESLIAASILYVVCVEALWKRQETPWYIVAGFGLIHGLGFASILDELALPANQLVPALLSFNLGIELGQLSFVLLAWGLLSLLAKKPGLQLRIQQAGAFAIILMAGYWLFERAVLGA